jgi:hypothetical protein
MNIPKPKSWKWTKEQAWDRFACACCGRPVHPIAMGNTLDKWTDLERDEYWISGVCPECWDRMWGEDD